MPRVSHLLLAAAFAIGLAGAAQAQEKSFADFNENEALRYSQAAVGRPLIKAKFTDSTGRRVAVADFIGKPLVINFIYTSCADSCNITTARLDDALAVARDTVGKDAFTALTIGFDAGVDVPNRMKAYARTHGVHKTPGWHFLSGDKNTVDALAENLGFFYFPSPKGFDHLSQVTIVNVDGIISRQIYGDYFDTPLLVDPIMDQVFGTKTPYASLEDLIKKVRLYCTIYDPSADRYRIDYGLFIQIGAGITVIGSGLWFVAIEIRRNRRRKKNRSAKPV